MADEIPQARVVEKLTELKTQAATLEREFHAISGAIQILEWLLRSDPVPASDT